MERDIKRAVIVSDLHIGLAQFRRQEFCGLLKSLHGGEALVLNGDTVERPYNGMVREDKDVVDAIREESRRREVIWLSGNHDVDFDVEGGGMVEFGKCLKIGSRLMVVHGDGFVRMTRRRRRVLRLLKSIHRMRVRLGGAPVHVSEFAKRSSPQLYSWMMGEVKRNAVIWAIKNGVKAITCGHTHFVEDSMCNGVRYVNPGSWIGTPLCYVRVTEGDIELVRV